MQKGLTQYKNMYRQETKLNKTLQKKMIKLQSESKVLMTKYQTLNERFMAMRQPVNPRPLIRKRKIWENIHCDQTKRQRLSEYGNVVFKSIKNRVTQCKCAALTLYLGNSKKMNYFWQPRDFDGSNFIYSHSKSTYTDHDHCYAAYLEMEDDKETFFDLDYSKIFDSNGHWQSMHKC